MKIKVVELNENGKIEFSKDELEKILNEAFSDGYDKGYDRGKANHGWWYSPTVTTTNLGVKSSDPEWKEYSIKLGDQPDNKITIDKNFNL